MKRFIDITGMKFGKWTVIKRDLKKLHEGSAFWICLCECGIKSSCNGSKLRNSGTKQCIQCQYESYRKKRTNMFDKLRPLGTRVIIKLNTEIDKTTSGIIISEDTSKNRPIGTIISTGSDTSSAIKIGDVVYFDDRTVQAHEDGHVVVKESDILGVIKE